MQMFLENLSKLRRQVQALVVVDNGSPEASICLPRAASSQLGFELIANRENLESPQCSIRVFIGQKPVLISG